MRAKIEKELSRQRAVHNAAAHNGRDAPRARGWIEALEWVLTQLHDTPVVGRLRKSI